MEIRLLIMALLILPGVYAIDTFTLDEVCYGNHTNGTILYRNNDTWGCINASEVVSANVNITTDVWVNVTGDEMTGTLDMQNEVINFDNPAGAGTYGGYLNFSGLRTKFGYSQTYTDYFGWEFFNSGFTDVLSSFYGPTDGEPVWYIAWDTDSTISGVEVCTDSHENCITEIGNKLIAPHISIGSATNTPDGFWQIQGGSYAGLLKKDLRLQYNNSVSGPGTGGTAYIGARTGKYNITFEKENRETQDVYVTGDATVKGIINVSGYGTGSFNDNEYDVHCNPDGQYCIFRMGSFEFGKADDTQGGGDLVLDETVIFRQKNALPAGTDIEYYFTETNNLPRMAIPKSGADFATQMARSVMVGGLDAQDLHNDIVNCTAQNYTRIRCDTSATGADLGIQDSLELKGNIFMGDNRPLYLGDQNDTFIMYNATSGYGVLG